MADDPAYVRFRKLCLALPETKVTMTWGSPHMRVRDKIFTGWGLDDDGRSWSFSVKLDQDKHAALVASDSRFSVAPYSGRTMMTVQKGNEDWGEIAALVEEGYRNVAPKTLAAKPAKKKPAKKKPAKKKPAKKR
jgi:hypothetical protein